MRYFHLAPEKDLSSIYNDGITADNKGEIKIITLREDFLADKFIFDIYAYEILGLDIYCLFQISSDGINSEILDGRIDHLFSDYFKILKQDTIEKRYITPYQSDIKYEGMGLMEGVFPVESQEKFTPDYKQKILEYLKALEA